ncbi:MAG: ribosome silencing factor [Solidesulfovibrio sp.]
MPEKKSDKNLSARDKAAIVASWLLDKKAKEVMAIDVSPFNPICDAMVLASAANVRQAKALAAHVLDRCGEEGYSYLGMEGQRLGQWVLLDLNDVLVNIFQEDLRSFYNIEGLWSEGKPIPVPDAPKAKTSPE